MAGMFDNSTVIQVQQANDIVDVISEHVSLKRKGREMVGLCPFHDDNRPSMNVNAVKQIFKCFACGAGGDVFKFLQMRENLTFPQAIERLAERAGIKLKPVQSSQRPGRAQTPSQEIDPNKLAQVNAWAANYFRQNLQDEKKGKYARDYLAQRQITSESINNWQLGLAIASPDDLLSTAREKNAQIKLLEPAGLVTAQNQDKFINRLMFTITDVTGRVIGFGGRTLDDSGAKYINSPATPLFDKSNSLYGLEQARHQIVSTGTAVVVEGYTDCIMAHQFGCTNIVATLGTSFTAGHGRILRRYAKKVILLFDSDVAGLEAANRALDVCLAQRIDIRLASVPEGKDPCDFLLAAGKERFEQLLNDAVDVFQFKWNRLTAGIGSEDTLAGKRSAIEEYLQTIATALWAGNVSPIDRGLIVNRVSKIIGLDTRQINDELKRRLRQAQRSSSYNTEKQTTQPIDYGRGLFATAQREVLEVLLNEPNLFEIFKQKITPDIFDVPILKQIAEILFEALNTDVNTSLAEILAKTESVELGNSLVELSQTGQEKGNFQARLKGALDAIERHREQKQNSFIKTIDDQKQFLRKVYENTGKENPHNVGMV
ncbi:MAG: DNA primase [Planctomycetes bacterium]|nr:DNA primase [Planctomycetota bacterium]MBL7145654.1 DNA primase [Phycisphaerae bacterium]